MMNKSNTLRKSLSMLALVAVTATGFLGMGSTQALALGAPNWNATGSYVINMEYLGTQYPHDMTLVQDGMGNLTGNGGSPAGGNVYTWALTSGSVSGDTIDFLANYTATPDAVTPQTVLHLLGTIAPDGTISGTWDDNYQGGARTGAVSTESGMAVAIPPVTTTGQIVGSVVGPTGTLEVTSIESVDTSATADGTFANGWKYVFNVTVPTNETNVAMKFDDWMHTNNVNTIAVANNVRISSPQANNGGATVMVIAANTYTTPDLTMVTDLDPVLAGIQVKITVEAAIPAGSVNGSYSTNYGIKSI